MTDREIVEHAREARGAVGADWICEASHHAKKDQHKCGESCPLQQRWHIAYQALRERLAQPEQEPVSLNDGRLTQYADGRIGVGTPVEQELVIDCPRCGHCCPQRKPLTDAVLAEREACAAMLDENAMACENPIYRSLLQANAQAIREMGQP